MSDKARIAPVGGRWRPTAVHLDDPVADGALGAGGARFLGLAHRSARLGTSENGADAVRVREPKARA